MLPGKFDKKNHAIIHFDVANMIRDGQSTPTPVGTLHFALFNTSVRNGEMLLIRAPWQPLEYASDEQTEAFRKALVGISTVLTKLEPQIWGYNPSSIEIPFLAQQMHLHCVPMGVLGKNPAPGRGTTYHRDFMDMVWNAQPRHFVEYDRSNPDEGGQGAQAVDTGSPYEALIQRRATLDRSMKGWLSEMQHGKRFKRYKAALDLEMDRSFDVERDGPFVSQGEIDRFADLGDALHVFVDVVNEQIEQIE